MQTPSTSVREIASRLMAIEAASLSAPEESVAERVCEKLRLSLTRFAGVEGFAALMQRSLVLARAEVPSLGVVKLKADGCFEGLNELNSDENEAGAALTAHFLWLLVTFVGEKIALRLVREAWPEVG